MVIIIFSISSKCELVIRLFKDDYETLLCAFCLFCLFGQTETGSKRKKSRQILGRKDTDMRI